MASGDTYVALTAGHIMNDLERIMVVKRSPDDSEIELKIAKNSVRVNGRPLGRRDEPVDFRDECAFLKISSRDLQHFNHPIPCLNTHVYEFLPASIEDPADPVTTSRRLSFNLLLNNNRLVVFKQGASTDLTMGFFEKILDRPPSGWHVPREIREVDNKDDNEWLGCVRWISEEFPFTHPGDSGSLVFAKEGGITVPLGIHIGSPDSMPCCSVFVSIETYCFEAEKEGWELTFTER